MFRCLLLVSLALSRVDACGADDGLVRFNRDIRSILSDKCFACHGPDAETVEGGLRLDLPEESIEVVGAIVPGDPDASEMIRRICSADEQQVMPPTHFHKPLTSTEKEQLQRWVQQGAVYEPHWSYTPMRSPAGFDEFKRNGLSAAIDSVIQTRLESEQLEPTKRADRVTLIRRLSFDLTGIPPTIQEVDRFVDDQSDNAYAKLVERLLDSPRYGERMAIHWLDLVRYADTVGYHGDQNVSQSPYRDYVIDAFNENMPYDQFVREQLAGDLLPNATLRQQVASGYNRLNQTTEEGGSQAKEYLAIYFADRVRNVSQVFMGATVGCAQCHDHKYDPYTAHDFYSLGAFFADLEEKGVYGARSRPPMMHVPDESTQRQLDALDDQIAELESQVATASEMVTLQEKLDGRQAERDRLYEATPQTVISRAVTPRTIRILPRGNWMDDSGEVVEPAIPRFLGSLSTGDRRATRLDLANWLCRPENPLTARTMVNRIWSLLFGRGITVSVDDLGGQGSYPSYPELLDGLALEFVGSGWDIKHLIRSIVMSEAYQRSSTSSKEHLQRDPYNDLFARQGRFSIEAEMVRDTALATSRLLVERVGGPSVHPYQPAGYYAQLNFPRREYQADTGEQQYRRGLYTHWQRTFLHPMLKAFDAPSREECTAQRAKSNTPLQALVLLNDPTFVESARVFAERIMHEGGDSSKERIVWAYRTAVSRMPSQEITQVLLNVQRAHLQHFENDAEAAKQLVSSGNAAVTDSLPPAELAAWTSVARVLLNLHETITRY